MPGHRQHLNPFCRRSPPSWPQSQRPPATEPTPKVQPAQGSSEPHYVHRKCAARPADLLLPQDTGKPFEKLRERRNRTGKPPSRAPGERGCPAAPAHLQMPMPTPASHSSSAPTVSHNLAGGDTSVTSQHSGMGLTQTNHNQKAAKTKQGSFAALRKASMLRIRTAAGFCRGWTMEQCTVCVTSQEWNVAPCPASLNGVGWQSLITFWLSWQPS